MREGLIALGRTAPPLVRYAASLGPVLRAVAAVAGPEGRACLIDRDDGVTQATTALTIVRALAEARGPERMLARALREILFEADRDLGDGTARLALLWGGIMRAGARALAGGVAPERLAAELERLGAALDRSLLDVARPSEMDRRIVSAVAASAGAAPEIARAIADMLAEAGLDGSTEIVESREDRLRLEGGEGFLLDAVPVSDLFAKADLDPAFVLVADERIDEFGPLVPLLEGFATRDKALVVVARDVTGPALHALVRNHKEKGLRAIALRPAAVGEAAAEVLEDLAVSTGATLVADRFGASVTALRPGMLGRCARFAIAGRRASFHQPGGDPSAIAERQRLLRAEAERQKFLALDRERLLTRAARLAGRWMRLHVGAESERLAVMHIERARRALASGRAALSGGTVLGGGLGLVRAFDNLPMDRAACTDAALAARHVMAAGIVAVVRGLSPVDHVEPPAMASAPGSLALALGVAGGEPVGLVDPLNLIRSILDRAVSSAVPLLRSGAVVRD
jgi:chaperonin GroEL